MKAIRIHGHGAREQLNYVEAAKHELNARHKRLTLGNML
jgi:hypothetical protein